jgi:hypothetical protein
LLVGKHDFEIDKQLHSFRVFAQHNRLFRHRSLHRSPPTPEVFSRLLLLVLEHLDHFVCGRLLISIMGSGIDDSTTSSSSGGSRKRSAMSTNEGPNRSVVDFDTESQLREALLTFFNDEEEINPNCSTQLSSILSDIREGQPIQKVCPVSILVAATFSGVNSASYSSICIHFAGWENRRDAI